MLLQSLDWTAKVSIYFEPRKFFDVFLLMYCAFKHFFTHLFYVVEGYLNKKGPIPDSFEEVDC